MNCKFCNAEVGEDHAFCPYCGKSMEQEEDTVLLEQEATLEEQPQKKNQVLKLVLSIVGAVVALGLLAVVLLTAMGVDLKPRANDIFAKDCYTVDDEKAEKKSSTVVATINGKELTNAQLQIYYRMQVVDFLNFLMETGRSVTSVGLDLNKPLSEQTCYFDENMTWEQYFLENSIGVWQNYVSWAQLAEENGYTISSDVQTYLDEMAADLQSQAEAGGHESVDAMIQKSIGPGCTSEDFMTCIQLLYVSSDYMDSLSESLTPTQDEIDAYYTEHEATFIEQGITKDSGLCANVRHILICPIGGTQDEETGIVTYTEAEWAAAHARAEVILNEWKNGEATEDSFAKLATSYTEDTASASTGGLYEGIYKNSGYVEPFENWAIDMERKPGDVAIIKADFDHYKGYHIMYFVSGEANWIPTASTQLMAERTDAMLKAAKEKWPMKVNYRKIAINELKLG